MKDITEFECESCSNERTDKINLARFFAKLDEAFSKGDLASAGRLIDYWERDARTIGDENGLLYVLNEETGYFRRTGEKEKGLAAVNEALELTEKLGMSGTVSGATVIINCATTLKAFGEAEKALPLYENARVVYESSLEKGDFLLAAFYNNFALSLADVGRSAAAEEMFFLAIEMLEKCGGHEGEIAVSYINLAELYHNCGENEKIPAALESGWERLMSQALAHDGNYAFICSKCAPAYKNFGQNERAEILFARSKEIYEGN